MSKLRELVDRANTLWAPQERPFTSSTPILGPAIVLVRRAWNWMSAKWYVRPILEQQIAFNAVAVQVINEMANILEALEGQGRRLEDGLTRLQAQMAEASAQLGRMEEEQSRRLTEIQSSLENQVREAEEWMMANDRSNAALARDLASLSHRLNEWGSRLPVEVSALKEQVRALDQALRGAPARGGEDADSLL